MRLTLRMGGAGMAIAAAGLLASACSSSPSASHGTSPSRHREKGTTTTTTTTTTSSSSSSSTTTTTSTTKAPTVTTCRVSGLEVTDSGQGGAAGTEEVTFALKNTSTVPCTTYGYPGMLLLSTSGSPEPTTVERGGGLSFENIAPSTVQLQPGTTAYFNVGFTVVQVGDTACSSSHDVEITPPTSTTHTDVQVPLGIDACDDGTLHVSAVFGSTDASATQTTAPS